MDPAAYRRLADHLRAVRQGMAGIRASADSPDGLITATVDARGELLDLELNPRVYRDPDADGLSGRIVATVAEATRLAQDQVAALTKRLMP
ncbi:YbaB/EbfC family nucleoid-associated protein [Saccharothrix sp. S26]|uniref:YbaB/EbfC family nucleoid-associated protein n=1 Tax=Saccharothrix sp. S26 TaxID=2907215 RepID=UPI001F3F9E6C|nr:YbaB/EbfC family nucleoid-associated protein [Saccharothrix sp. S26]MCE6996008.1 YbaB/EbfC family nucleoid-associated protein [Saccharothrix sp. S26]